MMLSLALAQAEVPTPKEWLGFDPTADGAIVDTGQVNGYVRAVAAATPRAQVHHMGLSTDGHPLTLVAVSDPENLRVWAVGRRPPDLPDVLVVLVTFGIHSDEVGSTLSSLSILYRLVARETPEVAEVRRRTLVLMVPTVNPDGTRSVAKWLRKAQRREHSFPSLYQRYCGHDLNRDWLLATQPETQGLIESVYDLWRPELVIDVHQMGRHGPRLFIPPFALPIDPALDANLIETSELLGDRVFATLADKGRRGVVRRWMYDAWSAARGFPFYRGAVRFLIEAASADYERPLQVQPHDLRRYRAHQPRPADRTAAWNGGRWGLPEISDTLIMTTETVLAAALDAQWRGKIRQTRKVGGNSRVRLNVADGDPWLAGDCLRALQRSGARLQFTGEGSWIVMDPPGGKGWCRSVLLPTEYPRTTPAGRRVRPPYDTSTHDLAALAGIEAALVTTSPTDPVRGTPAVPPEKERKPRHNTFVRAGQIIEPGGAAPVGDWIVSYRSLGVLTHIADLLESGVHLARLRRDAVIGGHPAAAGDFVIRGAHRAWSHRLATTGADVRRVELKNVPSESLVPTIYPELWVYRGRSPARDEGWLRWFLESLRVRFRAMTHGDLVDGNPASSNDTASGRRILIFAAGTMSFGLELEKAVRQWVGNGGRVIALGDAAEVVGRWLNLGDREIPLSNRALPGVILRAHFYPAARRPHPDPILWGYAEAPPLLYRGGPLWAVGATPNARRKVEPVLLPLLVVDADRPRVAGLLRDGVAKSVAGGTAALRIRDGKGDWVLMGFSPHFRGWTRATFRLLLNAVFAP